MLFRQIQRHGDNFSYLIADEATKEAAVVDPSYNADELIKTIKNQNLTLKYIINTHSHSDHTAGNTELQQLFGAKIAASKQTKNQADLQLDDSDTLSLGKIQIKVLSTPGHTQDGICLLIDGEKLLTGDTLFVGECGRTDLPGGNAKQLYETLFNKILKLNDEIEVYPGHDYGVKPSSTIGYERKTNYVLQPRTLKEFLQFMSQP
ncbi:MAG: MBL fold metallo-hydrolase [Candidatus Bathyarchaeia archaeon]|jgi:glyoxylase-like metal-dependent hydrolase (beta-lactamase superfamily II)